MRRTQWGVAMVVVAALVGPEGRAEPGPVVRVGVYQNPPKVLIHPDGQPDGIFVDLLKHVAAEEGWQLEFVPGTWVDHLQALDEGRLDLMPDVAFTPERASRFKMSRVAVLSSWLEIYSRRGPKLETLEDLRGLQIAVLEGSIQQQVVREVLPDLGIGVKELALPNVEDVLEAVQDKRADAGMVSRFFGREQAERFHLSPAPLILHPTKLVFAAPRTSDGRLLAILDERLARLKEDRYSAYYRILGKWMAEPEKGRIPVWLFNLFFGSGVST